MTNNESNWILNQLNQQQLVSSEASCTSLQKGFSQRNYRITDHQLPEKDFFVKRYPADYRPSQLITLFHRFDGIAHASLTQAAVYADPDNRLLVYPWIEGGTLAEMPLPMEEKITQLTNKLVAVHQSPLSLPRLNPWSLVEGYIAEITKLNHPDAATLSQRFHSLKQPPDFIPLTTAPCHLDLSFDNIMQDGTIIDWEYAHHAPISFDLACTIVINQLNQFEQQELLAQYQAKFSDMTLIDVDIVDDMLELASILTKAWFLLNEQKQV